MFLALAVGYVIGARIGSRDLDQITSSVKALAESDEFSDLLVAARTHAAHTLRELATVVDGDGRPLPERRVRDDAGHLSDPGDAADLVDRVRQLFARG